MWIGPFGVAVNISRQNEMLRSLKKIGENTQAAKIKAMILKT